jgi:hypothetical protein
VRTPAAVAAVPRLARPVLLAGHAGHGFAAHGRMAAGSVIRADDAMLDISGTSSCPPCSASRSRPHGRGHQSPGQAVGTSIPGSHFPMTSSRGVSSWRFRRTAQEFTTFVARCLQQRPVHTSRTICWAPLAARDADGSRWAMAIRDELVTVLMSGHETTAVAMAWAIYEFGGIRHAGASSRGIGWARAGPRRDRQTPYSRLCVTKHCVSTRF